MSDYHDAKAAEPEPLNVAFNEDETTRVLAIAERYAAYCRQHGRPIPRDPVRALLCCLLKRWRSGLSVSPRPTSTRNGRLTAA